MSNEIQPSPQPEITPELVAEFQKRQAEIEQKHIMDCGNKIMQFAQSLDMMIVASPQLVPDGRGGFSITASIGVQRIPK